MQTDDEILGIVGKAAAELTQASVDPLAARDAALEMQWRQEHKREEPEPGIQYASEVCGPVEIGDRVFFVMGQNLDGSPMVRPVIVTGVPNEDTVNGYVCFDGPHDEMFAGTIHRSPWWRGNIPHNPSGRLGTWHWKGEPEENRTEDVETAVA